ncbi:hypothetical protein N7478_003836 [Penicillium angulare]|uniref:uncharacterized protein n=1 Tax=Penicillium angulare TaxID=116970 RepID=UPI00254160E9|nr:uncharacterized protein N7478_003836 [Penicillium angulare]KAJ5288150.1 hypothetical protein N7478_003836 [Penicillium angulare]
MPLIREVLMMTGLNWTVESVMWGTKENSARVESAVLFVVGEEMDLKECACSRCKRTLGPFGLCVRIEGIPSLTVCAGCHWNKNDKDCDSYHAPPTNALQKPEPFPVLVLSAKFNEVASAVSRLTESLDASSTDMEETYEAATELLVSSPGPTESTVKMVSSMEQSRKNDREVTKNLQSLVQSCSELTSLLQEALEVENEAERVGNAKRRRIK